jgi:hypothetical protein
MMRTYKSKFGLLAGTTYREIVSSARREYHTLQKRNPRRIPNIRSAYFAKDKIFLNIFWEHIKQKHPADQERRLKLYAAAIDLIRNSKEAPDTILSKDALNTMMHRFYGTTKNGDPFIVQIKENKRTNRKDFMSVFPGKIKKASR